MQSGFVADNLRGEKGAHAASRPGAACGLSDLLAQVRPRGDQPLSEAGAAQRIG